MEGLVLKANLFPLEMFDFDVILGMDWLSNHRTSMNCFTKRIRFEKLGYLELEITYNTDEGINKGNMMFKKINHKPYHETVLTCSRYERDRAVDKSILINYMK